MIKENLLVAIRSFWKAKTITLINILGLSIGISAALVIFLIVQYQHSFDKHQPNGDRTYRVVTSGSWKNSGVPAPLPRMLKNEGTGIEAVSHFFQYDDWNVNVSVPVAANGAHKLYKKQKGIVFADADYFKVFPHEWVMGSPQTSLGEPNNLVISERRLKQYFPDLSADEVMGKTLFFGDTLLTNISGVVKDVVGNSDVNNSLFISMASVPTHVGLRTFFNWEQWGTINDVSQCFVLLAPGTHPQTIEKQIASLFTKHAQTEPDEEDTYSLQALEDVHFNTDYNANATDKSILRNLVLLALFLLLLGTINFINLSTAQSIERAKEIGVRKTLGSSTAQLMGQFLQETFLVVSFSTILSLFMLPLLFKAFSGFVPKELTEDSIFQKPVLLFILGEILVVTFLAGLYPAFVLSRYNPIQALKNQAKSSAQSRSVWVRKSLTVIQFVIAQVFVIGVLMVSKQIDFAVNKDMGFRKDAIVNFYIPDFMAMEKSKKFVLLEELRKIPEIQAISLGNQSPAFNGSISNGLFYKDGEEQTELSVDARSGDDQYLAVYDIPLLAGRNIHLLDSGKEVLINESMLKLLGFKDEHDAIGKTIEFGETTPIVGVMQDFNLASVRSPVRPLMFYGEKNFGYVMHIALQAENRASWAPALEKTEKAWQKIYPNDDFEYTFLDKTVEGFYRQDTRLSTLLTWAMGLAIFISCMGLLGLVTFLSNQRTKEIGVRKVLGASVFQIIALLSKSLVSLVALACLIAFPIAWYFIHHWLQDFAYHIPLQGWVFLLSGSGMLLLAWTVLCIRAGKAAMANPMNSLRDE